METPFIDRPTVMDIYYITCLNYLCVSATLAAGVSIPKSFLACLSGIVLENDPNWVYSGP